MPGTARLTTTEFGLWLIGLVHQISRVRRLRRRPGALTDIRRTMLEALVLRDDGAPPSSSALRLHYRLQACEELTALWYLRSDLMQLLSARDGERAARHEIDRISALFNGLLPSGHSGRAPLR